MMDNIKCISKLMSIWDKKFDVGLKKRFSRKKTSKFSTRVSNF